MALFSTFNGFTSGSGGVPTRSLLFDPASATTFSITDTNFGSFNRAQFAISFWYKRSVTSAIKGLYIKGVAPKTFGIFFTAADKIDFSTSSDNATNTGHLVSNGTFTDTASWHHILAYYDSANGTANNRMRIWHDGSEITSFATRVNPSSAVVSTPSNDVDIGGIDGANILTGNIYQPAFFSGFLPDISMVYNSGHPLDVTSVQNLWSLLNTNASDALTKDYILTPSWTNANVTKSTDIPT